MINAENLSPSKVALVTGASRGIGLGVTRKLASAGFAIGLVGRDEIRLAETANSISRDFGVQTHFVVADVANWEDCNKVVEEVISRLGDIEILVANAGIGIIGRVSNSEPSDWKKMMEINYLGTAQIVKAVLPNMEKNQKGDIVAIASAGGTKGYPSWSGYCASKWAVVGFMECLAQEVIGSGIRVTTLCPGGVSTPFWDDLNEKLNPIGSESRNQLMTPDDVAEVMMVQLNLPRNVLIKNALFFPVSEWH